jgi:hypothetical protein
MAWHSQGRPGEVGNLRKGPGRPKISETYERALLTAILDARGPVARSDLRALLPHGITRTPGLRSPPGPS